jgi:cytochrome c551/c552
MRRTLGMMLLASSLLLGEDVHPAVVTVPDAAAFDRDVKPVITKTCVACHNPTLTSGGVNLTEFSSAATISSNRAAWEKILQKVRSAEMPPKGVPRPPQAQMDAFVAYLQSEFEKADRNVKPDPGRVTVRRLNRTEYSNSIRDILAVDFRAADEEFPTDDLGEGFDNLADVLSTSPLLLEKYVAAAETIAARAVGDVTLPKPVTSQYDANSHNLTRVDVNTIEASHRLDFDADYDVMVGMPGERSKDAAPVKLGFWMDGKLLQQVEVETKPSDLVYFSPFSETHFRVFLPAGEHVFRAAFLNDDYVKTLPENSYYAAKKNKYPGSLTFSGPFPTKTESVSRKKLFTCDVNENGCVSKILTGLAHQFYRHPPTTSETAQLMSIAALARQHGETAEGSVEVALQAILVSPNFLFRIEHDPEPTNSALVHKVSDLELATRLSYFLWSSTPDQELLQAAEQNKLHEPAVLETQVKRMLNDPHSSALVENFVGQWLELRNLDSVKPDQDRFLSWGPELKESMKMETKLFVENILRENRPLPEMLDARYTYLDERLAKFYGVPDITGPEFRKVELTGDQRGGILTQASVLTVSSYPTRTSPTIRGKYILNNILGTPPPPPPPDVPALDASKVGSEVSLRSQLSEHRSNAMCASCHSKMDVLGFGLENYNGIGKWRTMDGKFPIDTSGTLPGGKSFVTAQEMRAILASQTQEFAHCVTEKMMVYALGRGLQVYDRPTVNAILTKLQPQQYPFQSLVYEVVRSLPFQSRRGELVTKQEDRKPKETASR